MRRCDPTDRDNWMMIADWARGANGMDMDGRGQRFVETAIEAIERGHALPQNPHHVE